MEYVQSFISNIAFPTSLEELFNYSSLFNLEMILGCNYCENGYNDSRNNSWTAPKWCKKGDIVFFMHSKTAFQKISALKTKLQLAKSSFDEDEYWIMLNALIRAKALYNEFGGKIFAIGRIGGDIIYEANEERENLHWKSSIYAPIEKIFLLEHPIDISEFKAVIKISTQSSITPILGSDYKFLKNLIISKNRYLDDYFVNSVAEPIPLSKINENNWLEIVNKYRRSFFLEIQFRRFYVDYLLKEISDIKTIYRECACYKNNQPTSYVDNVIKFNNTYLKVEIKLSANAEAHINTQLQKYCGLDSILLEKGKLIIDNQINDKVLVIDTDNIYLYYYNIDTIKPILSLDTITSLNHISQFKESLKELIK